MVKPISKKVLRINEAIRRVNSVRLIDQDNNQIGIIDYAEAMIMARDVSMDLVEIAPESNPPVCRIMDFGKWLYQQKRKVREAQKKSQHAGTLKEIRLRPETDVHDLEIKIKNAKKFLAKSHKVQFTVFFRGRQMLHKDRGLEKLKVIAEKLAEIAKVERSPKMTHRRMTMMMVPLK